MARKKEFGSINQPLNSTQRSITWNRGKRTVVKSKVKANKKTGEIYRSSSSSTVNVFGLIVIILFAVVLIRTLAGVGSSDVTFQGFLDFLTTVPQIDISSFINYTFESLQAPDWLGFLAVIWNMLVGFLNIIAFIAVGLVNAVVFITWFLAWIF